MGDRLKDSAGKSSSKRFWGSIGMGLFFATAVSVAINSVITGNDIGENAVSLINFVGIVSGSLLGIGVVERFAPPKKDGEK
jgi:uncharacterized membrane protein